MDFDPVAVVNHPFTVIPSVVIFPNPQRREVRHLYHILVTRREGAETVPAELARQLMTETMRVWVHAADLFAAGVRVVQQIGPYDDAWSERTVSYPAAETPFGKSYLTMFGDALCLARPVELGGPFPEGTLCPMHKLTLTVTDKTTTQQALDVLWTQVDWIESLLAATHQWPKSLPDTAHDQQHQPVDEEMRQTGPEDDPELAAIDEESNARPDWGQDAPAKPKGQAPASAKLHRALQDWPPTLPRYATVMDGLELAALQRARLVCKGVKIQSEEKVGRGGGTFASYRACLSLDEGNGTTGYLWLNTNKEVKAFVGAVEGVSLDTLDEWQNLSEPVGVIVMLQLDDKAKPRRGTSGKLDGLAFLTFVDVVKENTFGDESE